MKPLLLLTTLLFSACELYLSDDPFRTGKGKITGTAEINGTPTQGALVHTLSLSTPVPTTPDGSFLLENLPAGEHDIIIRAASEKKALRKKVTVVDNHTSNLGTVTLKDAIDLKVVVMDPELPIKDAQVRLQEVPGLAGKTSTNGVALMDCIPPQATYTATATYLSFQFLPATGPEDANWDQGLLVEPDPVQKQIWAKVHHAYLTLSHLQQDLEVCTADCGVPEWWTWPGPPCPVPIGEINEQNITAEAEWRSLTDQISKMERLDASDWISMSCPERDEIQSECLDSRCELMSGSIVDMEQLAVGHESVSCFAGDNFLVTSQVADLYDVLSCLGVGVVDDAGPDELFVLYQLDIPFDFPRLALALSDATGCRLFFEGTMYPSQESSQVPPGDLPWIFYRLRFEAGRAPSPASVEAHLSWINPTQ